LMGGSRGGLRRPPRLGRDRREHQRRRGEMGHEALQQRQPFGERRVYERARAEGGAPDGQTRDEESGGCAAAWTEAERGPDQQRKEGGRPDEEVQRGGRLQPEDEPAENDP